MLGVRSRFDKYFYHKFGFVPILSKFLIWEQNRGSLIPIFVGIGTFTKIFIFKNYNFSQPITG